MKITVEIDCTPEEARRAMGMPDVAAWQEKYLGQLAGKIGEGGVRPEALEALVKGWMPIGEAGLGVWRALMEAASSEKEPPR